MEKPRDSKTKPEEKMPAAGPHATPKQTDENKTPGAGTLPKPGASDPNDMAPTG